MIIGAIMGLTFLIKIISVYMTYMIINNNRKIKLHLTCKFMKKNKKINFLKTIRKHLPHKLCNFFPTHDLFKPTSMTFEDIFILLNDISHPAAFYYGSLLSICNDTYLILCLVSDVNQRSLLFVLAPLMSGLSATIRKWYGHMCN